MKLTVKDKETKDIVVIYETVDAIREFSCGVVVAYLSLEDDIILRRSNDIGSQEYVYELEV